MIDLTGINYSAVIVSSIIYYIIGFLWYSKLFGETWRKETGVSAEPKPGPAALIGQFASTFLYVFGVAIVLKMSGLSGIGGGFFSAIFATVLFAMPINSGNIFFTGKRKLYIIDVSERAFGSLVVGVILGLWQ